MKKRTTIIPGIFIAALATSISGTAYAEDLPQKEQSECIYNKTYDYTQAQIQNFCFTVPEGYTNKIPNEKQFVKLDENFNVEQYAQDNALNNETVQFLQLLQQDKALLVNQDEFVELSKVQNINTEENVETINIDSLPWDNIYVIDDNVEEYINTDKEKQESEHENNDASTSDNLLNENDVLKENDSLDVEKTDNIAPEPRFASAKIATVDNQVASQPVEATKPVENDNSDSDNGNYQATTETVNQPVENSATPTSEPSPTQTTDVYGYPTSDSYGTGTEETPVTESPAAVAEPVESAPVTQTTETEKSAENNITYDTGSSISTSNTAVFAAIAGLFAISILGFGTLVVQRIKK